MRHSAHRPSGPSSGLPRTPSSVVLQVKIFRGIFALNYEITRFPSYRRRRKTHDRLSSWCSRVLKDGETSYLDPCLQWNNRLIYTAHRYWHIQSCARHGTVVSWTLCPCSWSAQSASSTVSKHQSLGRTDLQACRSRWPDLSGCWIADVQRAAPKTLQRRRHCQSSGVDWRQTSSGNHIPIFWSHVSVDTLSDPCSDASYLGYFNKSSALADM